MARNFYGIEKGLDIYAENGSLQVRLLSGSAAPDGLGDQSSAPIGSLYIRNTTGELYQKVANAGNSADYQLNGASSAVVGKWRGETVSVVTGATQGAGVRDMVASPFSDDDGTPLPIGTYVVGQYVISGAGGTPVLLEITDVTGDDVTFALASNPLVAEDTFVCKNYLPDPNGGENRALVNYNGSVIVKLSDIDWQIATGINLSGSYAAASGNVAAADTVEAAIAKLDGVNDNQDSLLGTAQGAVNLGTFTGATIPDSSTVKGALQSLETAHEEVDQNVNDLITLSGVAENSVNLGAFAAAGSFLLGATETIKSALQKLADYLFGLKVTQTVGVTTITVVDSLAHATYKKVSWHVEVFVTGTPANRESFIVDALTDGTNVDDTKYAKLKLGANIAGLASSVAINGANLELRIVSTPSVTVNVRRITVN
jgi:hypothetical protein